MGEVPGLNREVGFEKAVELLFGTFADVKHQQLFAGMGLEIGHHFRVMLIPVVQPASLQLPAVADPLWSQSLEVGRGELPLVVAESRLQPMKGISSVEDE